MKNWERTATVFLIGLVLMLLLAIEAGKPCTLSFEAHKGQNFNQPYPTYRHCNLGVDHPTQTTDIYGTPLK